MLNSSFVTPKGRDREKDTERELRRTNLNGVDEAYGVTLKKKKTDIPLGGILTFSRINPVPQSEVRNFLVIIRLS